MGCDGGAPLAAGQNFEIGSGRGVRGKFTGARLTFPGRGSFFIPSILRLSDGRSLALSRVFISLDRLGESSRMVYNLGYLWAVFPGNGWWSFVFFAFEADVEFRRVYFINLPFILGSMTIWGKWVLFFLFFAILISSGYFMGRNAFFSQ